MKKMLFLSIIASSLLVQMTAQAETLTAESYRSMVKKLAAKPPFAGQADVEALPFDQVVRFQKETSVTLQPLLLGGSIVLSDSGGSLVIEPANGFYVSKGNVQPLMTALSTQFLSDIDDKAYPSHALPDGVKKTADMYVMTDPTCGYCKAIDDELDTYLKAGVQIHYIPYPRGGLGVDQPGFQQWAMATCASDDKQQQAKAYHDIITQRDAGKYKPATDLTASCTASIQSGFALGRKIGVKGTPFVYIKRVDGSGFSNPGFMPAAQMLVKAGVSTPATSASAASAEKAD